MGTNFYAFNERITEGTDLHEGLHIGKNSGGWVFNFQAHENLRTVKDYKDFLRDKVIYDEYEREIPYNEFWVIVEYSKEEDHFGVPYSYSNPPSDEPRSKWYNEWEDEGYMFTETEFY